MAIEIGLDMQKMKIWVYIYDHLQTQITQIKKYSRTELLYMIHVIQIVNDRLTLGECCLVRRRLCFFLCAEPPFGLARSLPTPDCTVPDVAEFRLPRTYCCQEGDLTRLQPCRRCWAVWRDRRTSMSGWVEQFPRVCRWELDTRLHPIVPAETFWFSLQTKTNHCAVSHDKKSSFDWLIDWFKTFYAVQTRNVHIKRRVSRAHFVQYHTQTETVCKSAKSVRNVHLLRGIPADGFRSQPQVG